MTEHDDIDDRDQALLAELRGAFGRLDPVPGPVLDAAHAAIELRDLDAQIAELLRDSAVEDPELAGVRGDAGRMLTFGFADRFIEVEIAGGGADREATGYIVPAAAGRVVAETAATTVPTEIDEHGRFRFLRLPGGPTRLRVELTGVPALVTPWTAI